MQNKYVFLEGNVKTIKRDFTGYNGSKGIFFRKKVPSKSTYLRDKLGNKVNLNPRMNN